jgi:hypothetical protein
MFGHDAPFLCKEPLFGSICATIVHRYFGLNTDKMIPYRKLSDRLVQRFFYEKRAFRPPPLRIILTGTGLLMEGVRPPQCNSTEGFPVD